MEPIVSFGYWLRRQRKALDLTQQALADQVGCSLAAIKKIEQDERRPSLQIAELLADVLGVPSDQREIFLEVARGIRPVDQLVATQEPATSALPTGIVTFLFTDMEESTKLAQAHAEEWEKLRARHHMILRETMGAHHGYVFQVVGDAFCVAFDAPNDALQAAIDSQRKLQTENWGEAELNVRMGIHTGAAEVHSNEYHGYLTLSLVQRIMSAGHGGQILLSFATENLVRGHLPKDVDLLDLGEHKFKDILQPVRVFQVITPDLQKKFPPLRTQDFSLNNLPIQLTNFIGREKEIADVIRLLEKARLVTLTGPGGTAKTRLAIQLANEVLDQYPDGVWMVELAPILDPMLVTRATAIAIGLRDEPHRPVIDMLCDYLREKKMLLLLDNCEHLIEACAQLADTLLHACPQIHILATSREALAIAGEALYLVPSLTRPDIRNLPPVESLNQYEAIQLFMDRATSAVPAFTLTNKNAFSIAHVCQRLDGIPLAIELVATKVRVLTPGQIAQRLDDRFHLLTGGSRTALPRHQTLQAAIDWSYNLLSPVEQALFIRLSVFLGGWSLEAAESICSDGDTTNRDAIEAEYVLDLLTQLVNKSLVMTEEKNGNARYHMLETIRQFGSDKLLETSVSESLGDRHLEYFLQLAEVAAPHLIRPEQVEWLDRLEAEHDNLCAALGWSLGKERPEHALRLAASLGMFWNVHGLWEEGSRWLELALAMPMHDPTFQQKAVRAQALYQDARLADNHDDLKRLKTSAESSLAVAQEINNLREIAIARVFVAMSISQHSYDSNASACLLIEKSISELQTIEEPYWESYSYNMLNLFRLMQADARLSEEHNFTEAIAFARKTGERSNLARALHNYARWLFIWNRIHEAQKYAEEATLLLQEVDSDSSQITYFFGQIAFAKGDYDKARSLFTEIRHRLELLGDKRWSASATDYLATIAVEQNDLDQAQMYYEESLTAVQELDDERGTAHALAGLAITYYLQGHLDTSKTYFRRSISIIKNFGWNMKIGALTSITDYIFRHNPEMCVPILGAVEKVDQANKGILPTLPPLTRRRYERAVTHAREALGDTTFELEFAEGQNMTLDEALNELLKTIEEM